MSRVNLPDASRYPVSRLEYTDAEKHRLHIPELEPTNDYTFRMVVTPLGRRHYAADYLVRLEDRTKPKRPLLLPCLEPGFVKLELNFLSPDATDIGVDRQFYMDPNAYIHGGKRAAILWNGAFGYLLGRDDDMDDQFNQLLIEKPPLVTV